MTASPNPQSLRARAYENFRQQILQANVQPGQFVSQRELMQLLDMPLGAVRELIPRLEAEGLLRTVPQRGLQDRFGFSVDVIKRVLADAGIEIEQRRRGVWGLEQV